MKSEELRKLGLACLVGLALAFVGCGGDQTAGHDGHDHDHDHEHAEGDHEHGKVDSDGDQTEVAAKTYPSDKCIVSGEDLGSMGDPVSMVQDGQEVKFCCSSCIPEFKDAPAKFLAKLDVKLDVNSDVKAEE